MSWFDAAGFANLAKTALKEAQKTLDKALTETEIEGVEENNAKEETEINQSNSLWETFTSTLFEKPRTDLQKDEIKESETDTSELVSDKQLLFINEERDDGLLPNIVNPEWQIENFNDVTNEKPINNDSPLATSTRLFVECESKRTVSSESIDGLGSISTTTPEFETDASKAKSPGSYESSVEVLSSSSIEILNSAEEESINVIDSVSSDSIEVINKINDEISDKCSLEGEEAASQSTLIAVDFHKYPSLKDVLKSSSSFEASVTEIPSSSNSPVTSSHNVVYEMSELINSQQSTTKLSTSCYSNSVETIVMAAEPKVIGNRLSFTLDGNSSCDDSTIVGSDDVIREGDFSIFSLKGELAEDTTTDSSNLQDVFSSRREESPSSAERTKVGSSGHTSGDELETATSSDIEIISNPNGDSSSNTNSRQSPAKLIYRSPNGKMSVIAIADNLIPEISGKYVSFKMSGHNREPSETSSGCSDDNNEIDRLLKKIGELSETLEARESKLIDLSMKNAELSESNSNLKSQLDCQMNEEFSQRLASLEKKFQQAIREKDSFRKQLETYKQNAEVDENKDQIIKELREEGEKLSKQQLSSNVLIKKLRTTEKDHLKLISSLREQYDGIMAELERAKKSLNAKESVEKTQIETINQLTKNRQKSEKQLTSSQSQIDNLTSTLITLQREQQEKDNSLTELKKKLDEVTAEAREETIQKLEEELSIAKSKQKELQSVISELRQTLRSAEYRHSSQEATLRQENAKLLLSVEEYKMMHENLQEQIVETTKPLSRQLKDEVSKYNKAVEIWQKKEHSLNQTISDLEEKLENSDMLVKHHKKRSEETIVQCNRYECMLEEQRKKTDCVKDELNKSTSKVDHLEAEINKLKNELLFVTRRVSTTDACTQVNLTAEKIQIFSDSTEYAVQENPFDLQESSDLTLHETSRSSSPTLSVGRSETYSSVWPTFGDDEAGSSASQIGGSIYDGCSKPIATATSLIENMQAQIKQREGDIQQLQWELHRRDHERTTLIDEVSNLTAKMEELNSIAKNYEMLQRQYDELLQMYGEKDEAYRELKMDMEDIKEIHKLQITQLIDKNNIK